MYRIFLVPIIIFCLSIVSCTGGKDSASVLKELEVLDSIQRKAHYEKEAALLGTIMHDSFYVASKGAISHSTKARMVESFTNYFKEVSYSYWENIDPPIVELDGDLAVVTYHKKTISTEQGSPVTDTSVFAWASVIKNIGGNWKVTGIITTDDQ